MNALLMPACDTAHLPHVDDTMRLLLRHFSPLSGCVDVSLADGAGRIVAIDAIARLSMPPCDRSAMDGYAYRHADTGPRRLVGRAMAGKPYQGIVAAGECVAIATGGSMPAGCDTVALREQCRQTALGIDVIAKTAGANIRRCGEDFRAGDSLEPAGSRLDARQIGLLAAAGITGVSVRPRLRVAVFSIGDELNASSPHGIADANRPMLLALCRAQGFDVTDMGILPDSCGAVAQMLTRAAASHDAILCSAGSCEGDEDHARGALLQAGGALLISGVAIRPGKPVSFGSLAGKPVIALPGNPAAAYVTFLAMGLPLLRHVSGALVPFARWQTARANFTHVKKPGLREYLRVTLQGTEVLKASDNGPAMLRSLAAADGLVMLDEQITHIRGGDPVLYASFAALEAL